VAQLTARAHVPEQQQRILAAVAWTSFPVSTALTLVLLDGQDISTHDTELRSRHGG
jgi:hypothetical protein